MADKPFDREIINSRERTISGDINLVSSYNDQTLREALKNLLRTRVNNYFDGPSFGALPNSQPTVGFIGDGFQCRAAAGMIVQLHPGLGFNTSVIGVGDTSVNGISGLNDLSSYRPLILDAVQNLTVPAADSSNPRIDLIQIKYDRRLGDPTVRDILNPTTGVFSSATILKTLQTSLDGRTGSFQGINYKTGTPAASPSAPSTDTGYIAIARIYVGAGVTTITQNDIMDGRPRIPQNGHSFPIAVRLSKDSSGGISDVRITAPSGMRVAVLGSAAASVTGTVDYKIVVESGHKGFPAGTQVGAICTSSFGYAQANKVMTASVTTDTGMNAQLYSDLNASSNVFPGPIPVPRTELNGGFSIYTFDVDLMVISGGAPSRITTGEAVVAHHLIQIPFNA